jgi:hypothetical protein
VQVINVMTRRGRWTSDVKTVSGARDVVLEAPPAGMAILYAVGGDWRIEGSELVIGAGDTLVCRDTATLFTKASEADVLIALISPLGLTG